MTLYLIFSYLFVAESLLQDRSRESSRLMT